MIRRSWLVLLAALLLFALDARADTCTFTAGAGNWTSATAYSGPISGCTSPGTMSADDIFVIQSGAAVTITASSTVSLTIGSITIQSGGSLTMARSSTLAVPDAGIMVDPGGTFTPRGAAVSYGDATPSFVTTLANLPGTANGDINTAVPLGKIIHCPGVSAGSNATSATAIVSDCTLPAEAGEAGTPDEIAVCWPNANINAELVGGFDASSGGIGEQFYSQWLGQIAAGDVLVFWDSTNKNPSRDVNSQYEVTFVNTQPANMCIGLSVRQGSSTAIDNSCLAAADGCHLVDRDVQPCTVTTSAYTAGARTLTCDASAVTDLNQRAGRNLNCPVDKDANGTIELNDRQNATIVAANQTTDVLRLVPGGLPYNVPLGELCFIDYGWKSGDLVSVYKPASLTQIQNPTCGGAGAPVACCSGTAPNYGTCGPVTCARGSTCDFDFVKSTRVGRITVFPTTTWDNTWIRESSSSMQVVTLEGAGPFTRVQLTSPAFPGAQREHGWGVSGGGTSVFTDVSMRHWGDDAFCPNSCTVVSASTCDGTNGEANVSKTYGIKATRLRAEYAGCAGTSCALFDECGVAANGGAVNYDVTDLIAIDAAERTTANGQLNLTNPTVAGYQKIRNAAFIANYGPLQEPPAAALSRIEMRNYYDIGRQLVGSNTYHNIAAHLISDASLIDTQNTGAAELMSNELLRVGGGDVSWTRVLVVDPDAPAATPTNMFTLDDAAAPTTLTDFAIVSPNRTGQIDNFTMFRFTSSGGSSVVPIHLNRITAGMRPGETNEFTSFFYAPAGGGQAGVNGGFRSIRGWLGAYLWRTAAGALTGITFDAGNEELATNVSTAYCDIGSSGPWGGTVVPANAARDVRQALRDPSVGNFEPVPGSWSYTLGCGARKAGARDMWALRALGHGIYNGYGDTWKMKGGGSSRRGPRATP